MAMATTTPSAAMRFRPCIDIHAGEVKQIVGSTLTDGQDAPVTNFVATQSAGEFAQYVALAVLLTYPRRFGCRSSHSLVFY